MVDEKGHSKFRYLTRDQFREGVQARDRHQCVVCGATEGLDSHHLIERRLWTAAGEAGGYFLENGATVCQQHHLEAEQTTLSCDRLRDLCGITKFPLPSHFYRDQPVDKWGNPILPNGMRLRGELFDDPSVQKVIAPVLALFTDRVKYGRTYHLPWSPGVTKDDRVLESLQAFETAGSVVVSVKQDGENTTLYQDYIHARSTEYDPHPSRSWVKAMHSRIAHDIPKGFRICGENLYARHSIRYENLEDYFQVFSVWNDRNECLGWAETKEWAELLGLKTVPVLYEGAWDEKKIRTLYTPTFGGDPCEGYVARVSGSFHYREFRRCVGKYVRADHVQSHGHWMRQTVEPNGLRR